MKWCKAYIEMKEKGAFVKRASWGNKYFCWLKPAANIQLSWCRDPQLKKVVETFGHKMENDLYIKAEDCLCLFNGHSVETGFQLRPEDKVADDWIIVNI